MKEQPDLLPGDDSDLVSARIKVCLPVCISPYAVPGEAEVECCEHVVLQENTPCLGVKNGSCDFVITQTLQIEIPLTFGATVETDGTYVACGYQEDALPQNGETVQEESGEPPCETTL